MPTSSSISRSTGGPIEPQLPPPFGDQDVCSLCGRAPLCGGLGYVRYDLPVDHPSFGQLFRCPNHVGTDPSRQEKLRHIGNLDAFADKTFATFSTDLPTYEAGEVDSLHAAAAVAYAYSENPQGWLLLEGSYGVGKTHLAAAIANARLAYGDAVLFITAPDLLDHLRASFNSEDTTYDEMFDRMRNAPLLVLDDLGVENPSGWAREKLFQLFNHRYTYRLPTVITTNTSLDGLDPRIRSRLLDEALIRRVVIDAPDYRTPLHERGERSDLTDIHLYREMRFDNFDTSTGLDRDQANNLARSLQFAQSYAAQPQGWLVLFGAHGVGKTHLAAAIGNAWLARGEQAAFLTVADLLDYLRTAFSPSAAGSFDRRFQSVRTAPRLILDDFDSVESATGWARQKLFQIINYRYVQRLPTVITTTVEIDKLDERFSTRLLDPRLCYRFAITAPPYVLRIPRRGAAAP